MHRFRELTRARAGLVATIATLAVSACGGFGSFTFTEESDEIEIEGDPITGGLAELFPADIPITVNLEEELEEQDATGARAVFLTDLEFRMSGDSDQEDFGFLNSIEIDVDADEQSRELLAWKDEIAPEVSFSLDVDSGIDLKPYVEEGMELLTEVEGNTPSQDARFRVHATFQVDVL